MNRFFFVLCFSLASCQMPTDDTDPIEERVDKDGDGFFFEDDCNDRCIHLSRRSRKL